MMNDRPDLEIGRVPTGIPGLDAILRGGFLKGGVYIVQGAPGAGKTILANQVCFNHVADGEGCAAYVTLLAESHTRMLQHLRPMAFFDEAAIPDHLYYVSAFRVLEDEGLKGLVDLIRREIKGHGASLLVLDGLVAAEETAKTDREFKKFIHEVQSHAAAADCTILLLTSGRTRLVNAEHTMVDGLLELDDTLYAVRTERTLQVSKFRGSGFLRGRHSFRITGDGIRLFPRIEAAFAAPTHRDAVPRTKLSTGMAGLDRMLHGGIPEASTTAVIGASGTGKTTSGLHFLGRSNEAEPGLCFSFFETPERLREKADTLGIDLAGLEKRGYVELLWQAQGENILDELGHRLIDAVRRRNVRRVFVDGLNGFAESATHPERISRFFGCMANQLRTLGATTVFTVEARDFFGTSTQMPVEGISALVENLIFLRFVEMDSRLRRLLSIMKVRDSDHDAMLREFVISERGVEIGETFGDAEAVLTGSARQPRAAPAASSSLARTRPRDTE
ncbi:MAG TPA: ATPase domain-containing protein [Alphaproteobacteria bacterium]|nr:ATPase domain-containing protein [Alphaproteobacteria bacterium]